MAQQKITFSTLANGAVEERFQQELQKVFENILDPNTEWKGKRNLTLTLTITPTEGRTMNGVEFSVKSKLAPVKNVSSAFIIDSDGTGQIVSSEFLKQIPGQQAFEGTETPTAITPVAQFKPSVAK
jgi:hypothetical protein